MGRSSGGFSGGHSSGGFGGGHSGGGRSFGGRSSFGGSHSSSSSHSSGSSSHRSGGNIFIGNTIFPRSYGSPRSNDSPQPSGNGGKGQAIVWMLTILLILLVVFLVFAGGASGGQSQNTTKREPLVGQVHKTGWYTDDIGWITDKQVMIEGLEQFYKKTGIQPYILLVPYQSQYWNGNNINGDTAQAYLENYYNNHFTDEAHWILAYFECPYDSKSEMNGHFHYLSGYTADTIMDAEALRIFWGYLEMYYNDTSYTIEEMFANAFVDTAETIMSVPTNGWDFAGILVIVLGVIAVFTCIVVVVKTSAKRKQEQEAYTKQILDTPLETFGTDTRELEKKYED